jgi:hypothetical protein
MKQFVISMYLLQVLKLPLCNWKQAARNYFRNLIKHLYGTAYIKVPGFFEKSLKKVETRAISVV